MKSTKFIVLLISFITLAISANAQSIEDALRYTKTNGYITPRAAGLNVSYYGISDDLAALAYNPA
jgi:hypothetical protein